MGTGVQNQLFDRCTLSFRFFCPHSLPQAWNLFSLSKFEVNRFHLCLTRKLLPQLQNENTCARVLLCSWVGSVSVITALPRGIGFWPCHYQSVLRGGSTLRSGGSFFCIARGWTDAKDDKMTFDEMTVREGKGLTAHKWMKRETKKNTVLVIKFTGEIRPKKLFFEI